MGRTKRRLRSKSAPAVLQSPKRPQKRKAWSEELMVAALEAVRQGTSTFRAAKLYGVPRSTLQDRVSGRVRHGTKPGPKPYLSCKEEGELSNFITEVAKAGYGKTRRDIKLIAENVAREKGVLKSCKVTRWLVPLVLREAARSCTSQG